jgi:hypothetical protein
MGTPAPVFTTEHPKEDDLGWKPLDAVTLGELRQIVDSIENSLDKVGPWFFDFAGKTLMARQGEEDTLRLFSHFSS